MPFFLFASANRKCFFFFITGKFAAHTAGKTPVFLAATLEYLCVEIMELAGNCAKDNNRRRIKPRDIYLAVHNDAELSKLLKHVTIPAGGTLPFIHKVLLPKHSKAKSAAADVGSSQGARQSKKGKSPVAGEDNGQVGGRAKKRQAPAVDKDNGQGGGPSKKRRTPSVDEGIGPSVSGSNEGNPAAQNVAVEPSQSEEF